MCNEEYEGYKSYEDWYDNGPGSENSKRRIARDQKQYNDEQNKRNKKQVKEMELRNKLLAAMQTIVESNLSNKIKIESIEKLLKRILARAK